MIKPTMCILMMGCCISVNAKDHPELFKNPRIYQSAIAAGTNDLRLLVISSNDRDNLINKGNVLVVVGGDLHSVVGESSGYEIASGITLIDFVSQYLWGLIGAQSTRSDISLFFDLYRHSSVTRVHMPEVSDLNQGELVLSAGDVVVINRW